MGQARLAFHSWGGFIHHILQPYEVPLVAFNIKLS